MKPVFQTEFHDQKARTKGNCLRACVASILELNIEDVPEMHRLLPALEFLKKHGWELEASAEPETDGHNGYYIVSGVSPRHPNIKHVVIYKDNKMVHDPHPDNRGVYAPLEFFTVERMIK